MSGAARLSRGLVAAVLLIVAGCQSPPTEFYTLSNMQLSPGGVSTPRTAPTICQASARMNDVLRQHT